MHSLHCFSLRIHLLKLSIQMAVCQPLQQKGMEWMVFKIMDGVALVF